MMEIMFPDKTVQLWHVGDNNPISYREVSEVCELQADGHELEWITTSFLNIPVHKTQRVQRFFGSIARQIVTNIPRKY